MNPINSIRYHSAQLVLMHSKIKNPALVQKAEELMEPLRSLLRSQPMCHQSANAVESVISVQSTNGEQVPIPAHLEPSVTVDVTSPHISGETIPFIGGWPLSAAVTLVGLAPNRRSMGGRLLDGRTVTVERNRAMLVGQVLECRLIRAGSFPMYRVAN